MKDFNYEDNFEVSRVMYIIIHKNTRKCHQGVMYI
eukprot:UN10019